MARWHKMLGAFRTKRAGTRPDLKPALTRQAGRGDVVDRSKGLRDPTKGPLVTGSGRSPPPLKRSLFCIRWAQQIGLRLPVAGVTRIDRADRNDRSRVQEAAGRHPQDQRAALSEGLPGLPLAGLGLRLAGMTKDAAAAITMTTEVTHRQSSSIRARSRGSPVAGFFVSAAVSAHRSQPIATLRWYLA